MHIRPHQIGNTNIAEIVSEEIVIATAEDGLDLLGNMYYQGFDGIILHSINITPEFFDLKTGIAGEILQKFSNYRMRLFIIGDFSGHSSKSLADFIRESNTGKLVNFISSIDEIGSQNQ